MIALENGIVPDVIPTASRFRGGEPSITIGVEYGDHKVKTGEALTAEQTKRAPSVR